MATLIAAGSASANIVRPAGATPIGASLVIAYQPCTPPGNATHNPANLPGAACTPPVQYTPRLTAGDPIVNGSQANFRGNVKMYATTGPDNVQFPSGAPNDNYVRDVRCTPGYAAGPGAAVCGVSAGSQNVLITGGASPNPDYEGDLRFMWYARFTEQANSGPVGGPYTQDATVEDIPMPVAADCAATTAQNIGSTCLPRFISWNGVCGCTPQGKRANVEIGVGNPDAPSSAGGIFVMDGGDDGSVSQLAPDADSPAPFAREGLFLP
jgi:hypothetical protein